jgi:hypothetical protein
MPALTEGILRPSRPAAYGLLARIYLSMRNYELACKYADSCLQYRNILLDYNNTTLVKATSNVPFPTYFTKQPQNVEIIFASTMPTINLTNQAFTAISQETVDSYDANDIRKQAFFRISGGYQRFKGTYSGIIGEYFSGIATNEMYLIRAECNARIGVVDSALQDINKLLKWRWKNTSTAPVINITERTALTDTILAERKKELLLRGLRWSDIKRLNKEGRNIILKRTLIDNTTIQLMPNSNRYALPIPPDITEYTGLSEIVQNSY